MELRILTIKTQKQKIMKKKFLGLALVAALGIPSFAAFAQQPAAKAETVCTAPDSCRKNCPCPFDGLNLTAQQQDKLKALKQAKLEQRKAAREADKAARRTAARKPLRTAVRTSPISSRCSPPSST